LILRVNELLNERDSAKARASVLPLFESGKLASLEDSLIGCIACLPVEDRKFVVKYFGDRIKQYLK